MWTHALCAADNSLLFAGEFGDVRLILVGGCRSDEDLALVNKLKELAAELGITVGFCLDRSSWVVALMTVNAEHTGPLRFPCERSLPGVEAPVGEQYGWNSYYVE